MVIKKPLSARSPVQFEGGDAASEWKSGFKQSENLNNSVSIRKVQNNSENEEELYIVAYHIKNSIAQGNFFIK